MPLISLWNFISLIAIACSFLLGFIGLEIPVLQEGLLQKKNKSQNHTEIIPGYSES